MWIADSSFALHNQVGVYVIPRLRIAVRKRPTPSLSLLSLTQINLRSVITGRLVLMSWNKLLVILCFRL